MISITKSRPMTAQDKADQRALEYQEREREKKQQAAAAKAKGMVLRRVRADDGTIQEVWMYKASFEAMGLTDDQKSAAQRFYNDWTIAGPTLRAAGFEFKVDGGKTASERHAPRADARARLGAAQRSIGRRNFEFVVAFVINAGSARQLNTGGSHRHDVITAQFKVALDHLHSFYSKAERKDSLWQEIEKFNAERAAMIAKAEREVG